MLSVHSLTTAHKAKQTPGAINYTPFVWQGTFTTLALTLIPRGSTPEKANLTSS